MIGVHDLAGGGRLRLIDDWLAPAEADALLTELLAEVPWRQRSLRIAGRDIPEPRLTAWFGDPGAAYTYSGRTLEPDAWIPPLARLRERVTLEGGEPFNSVLLNLYRDGTDSMGFHSDDEPELGEMPIIASVSLGATRRFVLQHKKKKDLPRVVLDLGHGSLLVMEGPTQRHFRHAVPKQAGAAGPRVNLTFRRIHPLPAVSTKVRDKRRETG